MLSKSQYHQSHAHKAKGTFSTRTKRAIPMEKVDNLLTQLAARYRFSDPGIQKQRDWHVSTDTELKYIFRRLESWEAKWFVRLLLREYPSISLDEAHVFRQYHFLLPDLLKFQNEFDAAMQLLRGELSCYPPNPGPSLESKMRSEAAQRLKPAVGVKVARPPFHKAWSFKHSFQLVGERAWAAEVKYDGEYCEYGSVNSLGVSLSCAGEIHVELETAPNDIQIFSKNGKDATKDREALHTTIRDALRIGKPDCAFRRNCIVLAEMVLYSDKEQKILSFSKIRKHIKRSGSFLGTLQDSPPHEWEHLMLVYFDVLVLDGEPIMRQCLQKRRQTLRDLVKIIPGRSLRSQWTLLDFKSKYGIIDLKQAFALSLVEKQEGLILKPLGTPYFPFDSKTSVSQPGYFIKLKRDYLGDMGGQRDLGDFAIIGACYDPQLALKTDLKPLHWTHFHVGCVTNKLEIQRFRTKPRFRVVGCLSLNKQISKSDLKHLNQLGRIQQVDLGSSRSIDA
jgi:DNA ligase-4